MESARNSREEGGDFKTIKPRGQYPIPSRHKKRIDQSEKGKKTKKRVSSLGITGRKARKEVLELGDRQTSFLDTRKHVELPCFLLFEGK